MFRTRLLSGIVLVIIELLLIIPGGDILLAGSLIISLIGMYELYRVFKMEKELPAIIGYGMATLYYLNLRFALIPDMMMFVLGSLIILMFIYVFTYPKYKTEQLLATFFGLFYVAVMLSYIYQTRMIKNGAYIVWLIILCSWGCDTCAYVVGKLIGKKHIFPELSPHKSLEGCIGGVVGAALIGGLYAHFFVETAFPDRTITWIIAFICAAGAVMSMVGDLAASAIKRNHNIKDYGKLIPGHGGIMDRFDSMTVTAPMTYFLTILLMGLR